MALSDISIERKTIKFDDQSFDVRGLSFTDLMSLFSEHQAEIAAIFGAVTDLTSDDNIDALLGNLFSVAPNAVNTAIALAADEPDMADLVSQLPLPVVTEAATAVASLTFKSEEDLVNFIESLTAVVAKASMAMDQSSPQAPSSVQ